MRPWTPNPDNNISSFTVRRDTANVQAPYFSALRRSIAEHAVGGAHAGDPVTAVNPEAGELHYSLSGRCHDWFQVHNNGQIVLNDGGSESNVISLDYREQWAFPLTLKVSDHLGPMAQYDTAVDDHVAVLIEVIDTPDDAVHPTVTFTRSNPDPSGQPDLDTSHPVVGYAVDIETTLVNLPDDVDPNSVLYDWQESDNYIEHWWERVLTPTYPAYTAPTESAQTITYTVHVKWRGGGITAEHEIEWFEADTQYPGPGN